MLRSILAALAAAALSAPAFAQSAFSPASQQVQLLAPQLVPFSGSNGNFESLVTGLTSGTAITLATVAADGSLQIVTFTPGSALTVADTARLLEAARQNLIVRGIAAPNGPQLAASLLGGTIVALSGPTNITGVLTGTTTSPTPVQVRTDAGALQSGTATSNLSAAQLQAVRNALATGTGVILTTGTGATTQNVTFNPTGSRLSDLEVNQALQAAAALLAQQGVLNPTADQLRAALFGGTLVTANGQSVPVQGVLQGRVRNTSDSPALATSASPLVGTSNSTLFGTSNTPQPGAGATPSAGGGTGGTSGGAGAAIAPRGTVPARPGAR